MTTTAAEKPLPLEGEMLAMDIADTLRRQPNVAIETADPADREARLVGMLKGLYAELGMDLPEPVLRDGVAAFREGRYAHRPPRAGLARLFAHAYVGRKKWGRWGVAAVLAVLVGLASYAFVYRPYQQARLAAAQFELQTRLPERMDALYRSIYDETKVQTAANDALEILKRGKQAAEAGNRAAAEDAVNRLSALNEVLQQEYTLRIVDRNGVKPAFWTFPRYNSEATNYFIAVEAVAPGGHVLDLPIGDEDTGETRTVSMWGLRVPEAVYQSVLADKRDDGVIQRSLVGFKQFGFLDIDYIIPVLGGTVTQW